MWLLPRKSPGAIEFAPLRKFKFLIRAFPNSDPGYQANPTCTTCHDASFDLTILFSFLQTNCMAMRTEMLSSSSSFAWTFMFVNRSHQLNNSETQVFNLATVVSIHGHKDMIISIWSVHSKFTLWHQMIHSWCCTKHSQWTTVIKLLFMGSCHPFLTMWLIHQRKIFVTEKNQSQCVIWQWCQVVLSRG